VDARAACHTIGMSRLHPVDIWNDSCKRHKCGDNSQYSYTLKYPLHDLDTSRLPCPLEIIEVFALLHDPVHHTFTLIIYTIVLWIQSRCGCDLESLTITGGYEVGRCAPTTKHSKAEKRSARPGHPLKKSQTSRKF